MFKLFSQLAKIEEKLERVREKAKLLEVRMKSPDGNIEIAVNGKREISELKINPEWLKTTPPDNISNQLKALINEAMRSVDYQLAAIIESEFKDVMEIFPGFSTFLGELPSLKDKN